MKTQPINLAREGRMQRRLEILGSNTPLCGTCGERDWRCLEQHHVADHGRDDCTVWICRNCHRKRSDDQKDHPVFNPAADPMLDMIGHFLLGFADMLRDVLDKLYEFALALIERGSARIKGDAA